MKLLPFDYAARNAGRNPLRTVLTIGGAAAVVFLVLLMGSFVQTLAATLRSTGDPRNVIVLGAGSEDYLEQSAIEVSTPDILSASLPPVRRHYGQPVVSPEIQHSATVSIEKSGESRKTRTAVIRGVTPIALIAHQQVFLQSGRFPGPGEVLVGGLTATKLGLQSTDLTPGRQLVFEGQTWKISGTFRAPGTVFDAEIWAPLQDLKMQTKRDTLSCVVIQLTEPGQFPEVDMFCKTRLDLELAAVREKDYYGAVARFFRPVQTMGWIMAGLIIASGLFGGLNIMMASINSRAREIACLQVLGFSRRAVITGLFQEALVQVGAGALLATGIAILALSGSTVRFTMGAAELTLDPFVLFTGFGAALALALLGTLIPSIRLLRTPLVELLRS